MIQGSHPGLQSLVQPWPRFLCLKSLKCLMPVEATGQVGWLGSCLGAEKRRKVGRRENESTTGPFQESLPCSAGA
jgi:hypothetical protein